ncbi:MAG: response regulator [Pseudomonadota bacterium]
MNSHAIELVVVEDNHLNQKLFRDVFAINNIGTKICGNSDSALEWLVVNPQTKIALVDIGLPGAMNGLDLIKYIRRRDEWQNLKIIAATAYSSTDDKKKIIAAGANYFMAKPLNIKKLVELVKYLMTSTEGAKLELATLEGETYDW